MLKSELIKKLNEIDGDFEVTFLNVEYDGYETINSVDVEHAYKMNEKGHKYCPSTGTDYLSPNKEKRYLNENNKDENEFFKECYYPDKKTIICLTW